LDGGFDPGRYYRVTYRMGPSPIPGVGLAALRDAAIAFLHRSDLPIHGSSAYAMGTSQAGRFLRQFLYDGFNLDEGGHRVFDAMSVDLAGAARGTFNRLYSIQAYGAYFVATQFPFTDNIEQDFAGRRDGLLSRYRADQLPKIFYTNTGVEYWE